MAAACIGTWGALEDLGGAGGGSAAAAAAMVGGGDARLSFRELLRKTSENSAALGSVKENGEGRCCLEACMGGGGKMQMLPMGSTLRSCDRPPTVRPMGLIDIDWSSWTRSTEARCDGTKPDEDTIMRPD